MLGDFGILISWKFHSIYEVIFQTIYDFFQSLSNVH